MESNIIMTDIYDSPKDCIRTNSGIFVNVFNTDPDSLVIEDMAHALASLPRFGGHLNRHYSIAQHSVLAAMRASTPSKKGALLHDGSEAWLLDMPTPIKNNLPDYKSTEHKFMLVIADKFGFEYPLNKEIKQIDADLLQLEWENLVLTDNPDFNCWSQKKAKKMFLKMFYSLD